MKLKGKHIFFVCVLYIFGHVDRLKDRHSFGISYNYGYRRLNSTSVVIFNPLPSLFLFWQNALSLKAFHCSFQVACVHNAIQLSTIRRPQKHDMSPILNIY